MSLSWLLFVIDHILPNQLKQFSFDFDLDRTCTISHVIVLSSILCRSYPIRLIITIQFCFRHRVDLNDRSRYCSISSRSNTAHCWIGLKTLVSYSIDIIPQWLVTLLSCLIFVIYCILPDWSWQISVDFSINYTSMISHIVVLSGLHHRSYHVRLVTSVQFIFYVELTYQSVTPLSYLVFIIDRTLSYRSW